MTAHSIALAFLAAPLLWAAPVLAQAACDGATALPRCEGDRCGCRLIATGWRKIAACDDHNWSYLLQQGRQIVVCTGVAGTAGPVESPCQEFKGNLEQYRILAQKPQAERRGGECVRSPAVTGEK